MEYFGVKSRQLHTYNVSFLFLSSGRIHIYTYVEGEEGEGEEEEEVEVEEEGEVEEKEEEEEEEERKKESVVLSLLSYPIHIRRTIENEGRNIMPRYYALLRSTGSSKRQYN
ncbi:sodium/potassium/calcium exchanger 1-like [Octopus bimaculoides]|uniref:sodium/potassium/calcium exchanger 1-like n=1 Tax=Octopus bimaculoides TaxID=37653 RepID=UPI0022E76860|nr:sodium/potassium/calcium exchanger 1-like [Octopus bimaculoides]